MVIARAQNRSSRSITASSGMAHSMASWIEYLDSWAFEIHRTNIHPRSIFEVDMGDGVYASFGEPRSKLGSKRYRLLDVYFMKNQCTMEFAADWMYDHELYYIHKSKLNKKVPMVDFYVGSPDGLVEGGYILACFRNTKKDMTFETVMKFGRLIREDISMPEHRKFEIGRLSTTEGVADLEEENNDFEMFTTRSLRRHMLGDWGDVCNEDRETNDRALLTLPRMNSGDSCFRYPMTF